MADIDVVPKHHSNAWLWIALAIVAVAVLFWAVAGRTRSAAQLNSAPDVVAAAMTSGDRLPVVA